MYLKYLTTVIVLSLAVFIASAQDYNVFMEMNNGNVFYSDVDSVKEIVFKDAGQSIDDKKSIDISKVTQIENMKDITVSLKLTRSQIDYATGDYTPNISVQSMCYNRFIKTPTDHKLTVHHSSKAQIAVNVYYYDENFKYILRKSYIREVNDISIDLREYPYFMMDFVRTDNQDIGNISVSITGKLSEYEIPSTVQNQKLAVPLTTVVNVGSKNSFVEETSSLQDKDEFLRDFGLLKLPKQYSNVGKPTRLIIFCHGSAIHYAKEQYEFTTEQYGMDPNFWLSEGYAVMDVEGNPFNRFIPHKQIPQAYQAYLQAYKWVVQTFNICKDGVFLGGRSMGAGMAYEIMAHNDIPVIATCVFSPMSINLFRSVNGLNATNRSFVMDKVGINYSGWSSSNPMTKGEVNALKENFKRFAIISPFWKLIDNLPDQSELFKYAQNSGYNSSEEAFYSNLRIKLKTPVKIFAAYDDSTVDYRMGAKLLYNMMANAASICELRMFKSGGHAFELDNTNCMATYTNSFGETLYNVPVAYVEALKFWRRYE